MFRHLIRLLLLFLTLTVVAGCAVGDEDNAGRSLAPLAPTTAPVATTAPVPTTASVAAAGAGFDCTAVTEIPAAECRALVAFYEAAGGDDWAADDGWLETNTPCSWLGVSCAGGHVDMLGIYYNDLAGALPAALADLAFLRVLDLHNNAVAGPIPAELGRLPALEYLDLSANQLSGSVPGDLGALTNLDTLNLAHNALSGAIPAEVGDATALRNLDLGHNRLSGVIPESLADLAALESLRLGDNTLEGEIPFGLGGLPNLSLVDLAFNRLAGSAPSALFAVPEHQFWGNQLDGTIFSAGGPQEVNYLGAVFTFDANTATSVWPELMPARPAVEGPGGPWAPGEHIVFTLTGDEPQDHNPMGLYVPGEAQIHIYPTAGLNEAVQPTVEALRTLLAEKPDPAAFEEVLPGQGSAGPAMLPPSNAAQMFRAQVEYLEFAEGSGVRYLTQLSQGPLPVNNQDLFYTFQGLTDDGETYVAAYYPVSLPGLPDSQQVSEEEFAAVVEDHIAYLTATAALLDEQPAAAFTPDLAQIDALISSLSVAGITPPPAIAGEGISPDEGATVSGLPVLQWPAVPGATSYEVVVLNDAAFPPVVMLDETVTKPTLAVELPLAPGHYSWTVRALAEDGSVLAESNRTFVVAESAAAPAVSLDTAGVATGFRSELVPAVSAAEGGPYWGVMPDYTLLTLEDYPVSNHLMQPRIFIFPVQGLREMNDTAAGVVDVLQGLIASPQEIPTLPFLPLFNAAQVMHAQLQYLDFQSGQGLRYVTEYDQAFIPINNYELIYTYQGLTADGKYYVAAVLPVTHPSLPADASVTGNEPPEFANDFPAYLANVTNTLNTQASNTYYPDLTLLDAMMRSLVISE